jgi:hypothetical protein
MSHASFLLGPIFIAIIIVPGALFLLWFIYNLYREIKRGRVNRQTGRYFSQK